MRRCSWIDLFQETAKIGETLPPEDAVMAHPIDQRGEPLRLGAIKNIAAFAALGDQASLLQRFQVLRDGALRHITPARQLQHGDLLGLDDPLEHGPPSGIGQRPHDSVDRSGFNHGRTLVAAKALVNTNVWIYSRPHGTLSTDAGA